jgi:hypothetical protein
MNAMLDSLLIAPVQRIPRYILLLRDLIKSTAVDHPDYKNLCASLALMQEVADHSNNIKYLFQILTFKK